jgi:tetratricopeptide (TPR) repeat protein
LEQAAAMQKQLLADRSAAETLGLTREYAQTLNALGRVHQNLLKLDAARDYYQQAARLREQVSEDSPGDVLAARELASTYMNLGLVELNAGDAAKGLPLLERAQTIRLSHAQTTPHGMDAALRRDLGMGYYNLAQAHLASGNGPAAETHLTAAVDAFEQVLAESPGDLGNRRRLAICHRMLGDVRTAAGDADAAIESYHVARDGLGELSRKNPDVPEYAADLAGVRMNLAQLLDASGNSDGAMAEIDSAIEALQGLVDRGAASPRQQCDHAVALRFAGQLLHRANQADKAREQLLQSEALLKELVREHPSDATFAAQLKQTADALAELDAI